MDSCRVHDPQPSGIATMDEETMIWEGHPSQLLNFGTFILCGLLAGVLAGLALVFWDRLGAPFPFIILGVALIPLLYAIARWLQVKCQRYQLTTERLRLRSGVLSRHTHEVELYRVKDYLLLEPFWLRLFGLSNVSLTTTDDSNPLVVLRAVPDGDDIRDQLRKHVELCRQRKNVRITEFEG